MEDPNPNEPSVCVCVFLELLCCEVFTHLIISPTPSSAINKQASITVKTRMITNFGQALWVNE